VRLAKRSLIHELGRELEDADDLDDVRQVLQAEASPINLSAS
jgi:hypothetical protein